ncbi:MAG: transcriptional regulator [Sedimenticola sp.]|nr:transcriptional regulator [Sedimenticola sp.]
MDRFDRIFDLHRLLSSARRPVSRQRIEQELECSRATAKRIIEAMRLYLNAPIRYSREHNGYYYDRDGEVMYELPGIWFNSSELHALLSVQQLLKSVQPGLLEQQLAPLKQRIESLLKVQGTGVADLAGRVRILRAASRPAGEQFQTISSALACRQQLHIHYYLRSDDRLSERTVSPQRLTYYRDNWYLDAWCHLRRALRTFALDAVEQARLLPQTAEVVDETTLDNHHAAAYGIFAGAAEQTARLLFSPLRARWVSRESWHPQQQGEWREDGSYALELPYNRADELVMDILRYGPDVQVLGPPELRRQVRERLAAALDQYR